MSIEGTNISMGNAIMNTGLISLTNINPTLSEAMVYAEYEWRKYEYVHVLKADLSIADTGQFKAFSEFSYKSNMGRYVKDQVEIWGKY